MEYDKLFQKLMEMALPRESDRAKVYYHGTSDIVKVKGILADGIIKPSENKSRRTMVPVIGRMYMTPDLNYALVYALGGIKMESTPWEGDRKPENRYGAVFTIPGTELKDIQPDEDAVGEMLYDVLNSKSAHLDDFNYELIKFPDDLKWLEYSAQRYLTPLQIQKVKRYDDIGHLIVAGKKLVGYLTDEQKLKLIDLGAAIANQGGVHPSECWLVDKLDSMKYAKDGSNFFQVARKVSISDVESLKKSV